MSLLLYTLTPTYFWFKLWVTVKIPLERSPLTKLVLYEVALPEADIVIFLGVEPEFVAIVIPLPASNSNVSSPLGVKVFCPSTSKSFQWLPNPILAIPPLSSVKVNPVDSSICISETLFIVGLSSTALTVKDPPEPTSVQVVPSLENLHLSKVVSYFNAGWSPDCPIFADTVLSVSVPSPTAKSSLDVPVSVFWLCFLVTASETSATAKPESSGKPLASASIKLFWVMLCILHHL